MRTDAFSLVLLSLALVRFCSARGQDTATPATEPTSASPAFRKDVMPILDRLGCSAAACHGGPASKTPLRLSMFGANAEEDYAAVVKAPKSKLVNQAEPEKSPLLLKVTGRIEHKGGKKIEPGSADYDRLVGWIAQGARWADEKAPRLVGVAVLSEKLTLKQGETHTLAVRAVYEDRSERDVTADARYQSADASTVSVAPGGKVTAVACGEAPVVVTYLRRAAVARVAVPQVLPQGVPKTSANNKIDELVNAKLEELGIPPADLCSDQEFVRRAFLDVIGTLPTPEETRAFLADNEPAKRSKLIDQLLERPEYADYWTLKWGDVLRMKSEAPVKMWPNAVQGYRHWVHNAISTNKPYDQFVTELLTATGSNFRNPPVNYYRSLPDFSEVAAGHSGLALRDPQLQAEATAGLFMGTRLSCARCHVHPVENWTPHDNLGMAAFFAKIGYKNTKEYKEEIVCLNYDGVLKHPLTGQAVEPKVLGGKTVAVGKEDDPRVNFAAWLTAPENPWFARNAVNRYWFWIFGRGIVHEPDDFRPTNPPANPELLAYLGKEFTGHKYDVKHVLRLILNSRTYQRSWQTNPWNARDVAQFSHYPIKRVPAEALLDAVSQITESYEQFSDGIAQPWGGYPAGYRAINLPDGALAVGFLQLFGRPGRDTYHDSDRFGGVTMGQELYLLNSSEMKDKIDKSPRIACWLAAKKSDADIVEELYLLAFSRPPSEREKQTAMAALGEGGADKRQAVQDLVWIVLNTKEFLFNH